jgi:hypothetical protein
MGLAEGQVGTGEGSIEFDGISSCLSITCLLDDDEHTHVGGHASLMRKDDALRSTEIMAAMSAQIPSDRKVLKVHLAGVLGSWHPDYLTAKPLYGDDKEQNYDSVQIGDCDSVVAAHFGVSTDVVTSKSEEGNVKVELTPDVAVRGNQTISRSDLVAGGWKTIDGTAIAADTALEDGDTLQNSSGAYFVIVTVDGSTYTLTG